MSHYGDLRDQMHPRIAATVPSTPEATALLNHQTVRDLTFGDVITKMVELELITPTSMDAIRAQATGMLALSDEEFAERLAKPRLIDGGTVFHWISTFDRRESEKLVDTKTTEMKTYFDDRILAEHGTTHEPQLAERRSTYAGRVDALEERIAEREAQGGKFAAYPDHIRLKMLRPQAEGVQNSRYAISVLDFITMLMGDEKMAALGTEFANSTVRNFIDDISEKTDLEVDDELYNVYSGYFTLNEYPTDTIDEWRNTWLAESEVEVLALNYAHSYYSHYGMGDERPAGEAELKAIENPLKKVFYISAEEKAAFFASYPLANGRQPH